MYQYLIAQWWAWALVAPAYLMTGAYCGAKVYGMIKKHGSFPECDGKAFFACDENFISFIIVHMIGNAYIALAPFIWPVALPLVVVSFPIKQYIKFCKHMTKDV